MAKHRAEIMRKTRAGRRTFWQALIPGLILMGVAIPQIVDILLAEAADILPEHWKAWLMGTSVAAAAISAALAKIMALSGVNKALKYLGLNIENEYEKSDNK